MFLRMKRNQTQNCLGCTSTSAVLNDRTTESETVLSYSWLVKTRRVTASAQRQLLSCTTLIPATSELKWYTLTKFTSRQSYRQQPLQARRVAAQTLCSSKPVTHAYRNRRTFSIVVLAAGYTATCHDRHT